MQQTMDYGKSKLEDTVHWHTIYTKTAHLLSKCSKSLLRFDRNYTQILSW